MGVSLPELERILRSSQEKFTLQEANVLMACKADALKEFTVAAAAAGGISWIATRRLSTLFRINLSIGAAAISGLARFGMSVDSSIERILSMDGSRMQRELANIILRKYGDDSTNIQHITKHFYAEKVFDDSSTDQPKLRWRHRNISIDNLALSQRTDNSDTNGYGEKNELQKTDMENIDGPKHVSRSPGMDPMANPYDCIFGITGSNEEIRHTNTSGVSPNRLGRSHKRSHRRHRMRRHEVP